MATVCYEGDLFGKRYNTWTIYAGKVRDTQNGCKSQNYPITYAVGIYFRLQKFYFTCHNQPFFTYYHFDDRNKPCKISEKPQVHSCDNYIYGDS